MMLAKLSRGEKRELVGYVEQALLALGGSRELIAAAFREATAVSQARRDKMQ